MDKSEHFKRLENMYAAAPINAFFMPRMSVSEAKAVISIELEDKFFHAAGAVHGSVYFKMLDDAAFFAASSLEQDVFVLTTSFTTYLTRPVSEGQIRAVGRVVNQNSSQFIAEAILYDAHDREIARGNGIFVRSKQLLLETAGYQQELPAS